MAALKAEIVAHCRELGFQQAGVSDIDLASADARLNDWLEQHFHGSMHYMQRHGSKRSHPDELVPGTLRAIDALLDARILETSAAEYLASSYRFLRSVEARLRLMDTTARHDLPADDGGA